MKSVQKIMLILTLTISMSLSLYATTGFLVSEKMSGMNRICFYDALGSIYTLNVKSYELCPLTYEF